MPLAQGIGAKRLFYFEAQRQSHSLIWGSLDPIALESVGKYCWDERRGRKNFMFASRYILAKYIMFNAMTTSMGAAGFDVMQRSVCPEGVVAWGSPNF